jgi:hypothetical protein
MIYQLSSSHRKPALKDVQHDHIIDFDSACLRIQEIVMGTRNIDEIKDLYVNASGHIYSLDMLVGFYVRQHRSEFAVIDRYATQGYTYIIDPPAIFAECIGGHGDARLLNHLQVLALQKLQQNEPGLFTHLRRLAFNDYKGDGTLPLLKQAFSTTPVQVVSKQLIWSIGRING